MDFFFIIFVCINWVVLNYLQYASDISLRVDVFLKLYWDWGFDGNCMEFLLKKHILYW
jgi:hypothetical protein